MKAILISIKPKWVAKILNGEKTIEIRKTMPKCDLPIDVYIYCTKEYSLSKLIDYPKDRYVCEQNFKCEDFPKLHSGYEGKGKVVAKFTLSKVEHFEYDTCSRDISGYWLDNGELLKDKGICLTGNELWDYIKSGDGYAWHIDNLVIFDKPKEINEFYEYTDKKIEWYTGCPKVKVVRSLTNAPQSWRFVEDLV